MGVHTGRGVEWGALGRARVLLGAVVAALAVLMCAYAAPALASFGFASGAVKAEALNQNGGPDTLAGSHPFAFTTSFTLNKGTNPYGKPTIEGGDPKDVWVELPAGLIGNPNAAAKCTETQFTRLSLYPCPNSTAVGTVMVEFAEGSVFGVPLYNLQAPPGVLAEFGFSVLGYSSNHVRLSLRSGGDYGLTAAVTNIAQGFAVAGTKITMWGEPENPIHNGERGECLSFTGKPTGAECPGSSAGKPLLNMPTRCGSPLVTTFRADSWNKPGEYVTESVSAPALTGCEGLDFTPSLVVRPEETSASSPTGLSVDVHVPQETFENPAGRAESDVRAVSVALPQGMAINPASGGGLVGCSLLQANLHGEGPAACPEASKVGSVEIVTPVLEHPLEGSVYLASPYENPFKSLLALYLAVNDPRTRAVIKLPGHLETNPTTGQVTTTFDEDPQLPFEDLKMTFFGGQRAVLATPAYCGTYETTGLMEPWSHIGASGEGGSPLSQVSAPFSITSGPGGSACGAPGFAPSFLAGTASNASGGFGPFEMTLQRQDGEQALSTVAMTFPPGMGGMLASVPECPEAQANAGTCPAASQIGTVTVQAGVGKDPVTLPEAGRPADPVYLTGPYEGAPFGLSIVVPAQAGPFNLGTVVVRSKIEVNPTNAQVSIVSGAMPTMLQGIPLDVRTIHINVNRPGFMFNPTNCDPMTLTGSIGSAEGASEAVSSRFQSAGCRGLGFSPSFKVASSAKTSREDGASLITKIAFPSGSVGSQANLSYVRVKLPRQLPARFSTLKQACADTVFHVNPANCPAGSIIGTATTHTPVLPMPLTGPVYFVSHGIRGYPDLTMLMRGDGVTIVLEGENLITKAGVTTTTFHSIPDMPISSFELDLPRGPHSALGTSGSLCFRTVTKRKRVRMRRHGHLLKRHGHYVYKTKKIHHEVHRKLVMPTTLIGQDGKEIQQSTIIHVAGCGKAGTRNKHRNGKR